MISRTLTITITISVTITVTEIVTVTKLFYLYGVASSVNSYPNRCSLTKFGAVT
jgi:hypothetical protein